MNWPKKKFYHLKSNAQLPMFKSSLSLLKPTIKILIKSPYQKNNWSLHQLILNPWQFSRKLHRKKLNSIRIKSLKHFKYQTNSRMSKTNKRILRRLKMKKTTKICSKSKKLSNNNKKHTWKIKFHQNLMFLSHNSKNL